MGGPANEQARFERDWLRLRAPFDEAALSRTLVRRFADAMPSHPRLIDLGAGTGSALRLIAATIGGPQHWTLLDHDAGLLAAAGEESRNSGYRSERAQAGWRLRRRDATLTLRPLRTDLSRIHPMALARADGVLAFALIDLVSRSWIDRLVAALARRKRPILAALGVDGRISWTPPDADDLAVARAFRRHQGIDKGFGRALGPDAAAYLQHRLAGVGFRAEARRSDWVVPSSASAMLVKLLDGMASAAAQSMPETAPMLGRWRQARHAAIEAGQLSVRIGHLDVLGLPRLVAARGRRA
jgi:SAM-dependent methyltransferase